LWDRQLQVTWNIIKSLNLSFTSNTSARIEEPTGAVNRKLFPDKYKEWKDTIWRSILSMGTPWAYNQSFVASYRAPFNKIPVLDFLTGNVSYNATYRWDRGASVDGVSTGNTIANQASFSVDGRINFESLYNKIPYIKDVNKRFANTKKSNVAKKPKKFERTYKLNPDTTFVIKHNLRNKKIKITAKTTDGDPFVFKHRIIDANSVEILTHSDKNIKFTIEEVLKEDKSVWREIGDYTLRFLMSTRSASLKIKRTNTLSLPLFRNDIGNIFGQTNSYGPMSPGLDFAFGFTDENYIYKAKERGWLICDDGQTSPAMWSKGNEVNLELQFEPIKGLKIQLTSNRTDNRTSQIQFMYDDMPITRSGSYTKTHIALKTALHSSSAGDGYYSQAFQNFIDNIPAIADRVEAQYRHTTYPTTGFMKDHAQAGQPFNSEVGTVSQTSSDVLIPAFLAAYTGTSASSQYLDPFPSFSEVLPNWRITYDGLVNLGNLRNIFKSFTLSHAYQCTYSVGSYSSYLNWLSVGDNMGFTLDALTGQPIPSSPYNISSVAITEKFAPLIGVSTTLKNELQLNAEWRDQRTLTLNTSAGQIVEAKTRGLTLGAGYKIVGFNTILKMGGTQSGVSNDLTINADFSLQNTQALIRKIENNYTQATSGTRTLTINFNASYILSRRLTLAAYFDHQVNTPLVSNSSYPTTNTSYGLTLNLNLAR
jgi:cell surface protein SprA